MVHILSKDAVAVKNDLERLMSGGSYLDGWGESRYKSWMNDLFALHGYTSVTEREMGERRTDLIVKGDGRNPSIMFEFKVVEPESDEDLADVVEEGLKQIIDRRYLDGSEMEGAIALSVAFRRKTCEVALIDPV